MKSNWLISIATAAALAATGSVSAQTIDGSDHDLGGTNSSDSTNRICVYCHTPHNSNAAIEAPLWNRAASTETYTMYSSPTLNMIIASAPQGVSMACLGCHDGSIALDALFNMPDGWTSDGTDFVTGGHQVGPDLSTDHPISLTYDESLDPDFVARSTVVATLPLFGSGADQVECGSCHAVHDPTITPFLRIDNDGSAMCLTCHLK